MTQPAPQQQQTPLLARRLGPFPLWLWFVVFVLVVAGVIWWRRRQKSEEDAGPSSSSTTITPGPGGVLTPDVPSIIPIFPSDLEVTIHRPEPDQDDTPPPPSTPPPPPPSTTPPPPPPPPPPSTTPPPPPPPPPPKSSTPPPSKPSTPKYEGATITVKKYTEPNPHMESYMYGIWELYAKISTFFRTTAKNWQEIWNHPANAELRAKRGKPENIREGDKVFVPGRYL